MLPASNLMITVWSPNFLFNQVNTSRPTFFHLRKKVIRIRGIYRYINWFNYDQVLDTYA